MSENAIPYKREEEGEPVLYRVCTWESKSKVYSFSIDTISHTGRYSTGFCKGESSPHFLLIPSLRLWEILALGAYTTETTHAHITHTVYGMYTEYTPESFDWTTQNDRNEKIKRIAGYRKVTDDTDTYETRMTHGGQYRPNKDIKRKNFTKLAIRTLHVFPIIQHEYLAVEWLAAYTRSKTLIFRRNI